MSDGQLVTTHDVAVTFADEIVKEEFGIDEENEILFPKLRNALVAVVEPALSEIQAPDAEVSVNTEAIANAIQAISAELGTYIDQVLHNEDFQRIEGVWTGIKRVADEAGKNDEIRLSIVNADKTQLAEDHKQNDLRQSKLYDIAYGQGQGAYRGTPYGAILLDYQIDPNRNDDRLLVQEVTELAKFGAFPVFAGVSPRFFFEDNEDYGDANTHRPVVRLPDELPADYFDGTEWGKFRESENAFYLGLLLPRYLGRRLYKKAPDEIGIAYTEKIDKRDDFLWINPVFAMGQCLARSFNYCGWFHSIWGDIGLREGKALGGAIDALPNYTFDDLGVQVSIPTEFQVLENPSFELSELGFISLVPDRRETHRAVFLTSPSVHKIPGHLKGSDTLEERNYSFNVHLPYRFIACRIAHFAKGLFRQLRGTFVTVEEVNREMQSLLDRYVEAQHLGNQQLQSQFPIKKARATATETGLAGFYRLSVQIEPSSQFLGADIEINLTTVGEANE